MFLRVVYCFLAICFFSSPTTMADPIPKELEWSDLVPKDFDAGTPDIAHIGQAMAGPQTINAPVVKELDGQLIKIPGFVVPLEGDDNKVTEFLLVPYFGACVHVPPPPSNQLIYVTLPNGAPADAMYDPIWVTGKLSTKEWKGELAQVGYTMEGISVSAYDDF
ncbi:hypothetical protein GCM10008107_30590 [Psychrosphaera saromensis]|nr:hypothetical protein GCM10008107_30590 [Psychrosphaera saromensis]GLQ14647.1 hypothetical protein GCM10007917_21020 [Psychrosphaera saromensis]